MEAKEIMPQEKTVARIAHTGNVMIVKHQFLTVRCQYHILHFPFDVQKCRMPFGSWAYTIDQVQVESYESGLGQQIFEVGHYWLLKIRYLRSSLPICLIYLFSYQVCT